MEIDEVIKVIEILKKKYNSKDYKIIFAGDVEQNLLVEIYKDNKLFDEYPKCSLEELINDKNKKKGCNNEF